MSRWWLLLLLALIGGTVLDRPQPRAVVTRGGFRLVEGDFHVHTRVSDGVLSPLDVVLAARRAQLDVVAVTEHNTVWAARIAAAFSELIGGPLVIVGEEVTTRDYHLIALGLEETIPGGLPIKAALLAVRRQRGVAIAAHPVARFWPAFDSAIDMLDGSEVLHPMVRGVGVEDVQSGPWRAADLEAFYARLVSARPTKPAAIGSSDHHAMNGLGGMRTEVFVRELSTAGVLEALRAGRTVVIHEDGRMTGDAEMIAALEAEPLSEAPQPSYVAHGMVDAVLRTAGLVALLMLVFVAPRRR